ncbi:hypothetical protein GGE07_005974 [Sinorhizobium terangae]|nr:DUF2235 domain-containing protein [Sinorhizobium terangae]MBB4189292.1 hypothetical protein [Sinorhizobium terangae]
MSAYNWLARNYGSGAKIWLFGFSRGVHRAQSRWKTSFTPSSSGYLFAFANDAWQTYDNNRGSVKSTIAR